MTPTKKTQAWIESPVDIADSTAASCCLHTFPCGNCVCGQLRRTGYQQADILTATAKKQNAAAGGEEGERKSLCQHRLRHFILRSLLILWYLFCAASEETKVGNPQWISSRPWLWPGWGVCRCLFGWKWWDAPIDICHRRVIHHPRGRFYLNYSLFPRASERRVLPIVGVCLSSSHLLILTSSHLHMFSSSHLLIFTSSHLHIFSSSSHIHILISSHLLIFTSSHLHILTSSHLLIFTPSHLHIFSSSSHIHIFSSSHLLIFTSSHLHIFSSSHLHIFTSSHPHIFTSSHPHIFTSSPLAFLPSCPLALTSSHLLLLPSCPLLLFYFSSEGGGRGSANETARNATLSHETMFDRQKLR